MAIITILTIVVAVVILIALTSFILFARTVITTARIIACIMSIIIRSRSVLLKLYCKFVANSTRLILMPPECSTWGMLLLSKRSRHSMEISIVSCCLRCIPVNKDM